MHNVKLVPALIPPKTDLGIRFVGLAGFGALSFAETASVWYLVHQLGIVHSTAAVIELGGRGSDVRQHPWDKVEVDSVHSSRAKLRLRRLCCP